MINLKSSKTTEKTLKIFQKTSNFDSKHIKIQFSDSDSDSPNQCFIYQYWCILYENTVENSVFSVKNDSFEFLKNENFCRNSKKKNEKFYAQNPRKTINNTQVYVTADVNSDSDSDSDNDFTWFFSKLWINFSINKHYYSTIIST